MDNCLPIGFEKKCRKSRDKAKFSQETWTETNSALWKAILLVAKFTGKFNNLFESDHGHEKYAVIKEEPENQDDLLENRYQWLLQICHAYLVTSFA